MAITVTNVAAERGTTSYQKLTNAGSAIIFTPHFSSDYRISCLVFPERPIAKADLAALASAKAEDSTVRKKLSLQNLGIILAVR